MNNMQIFYNNNKHLTTIVLEVIRGGNKLCRDTEHNIRTLLKDNFQKVDKYNTKKGFWDGGNHLDRIILYPSSKNETHLHIYQGPKEKVDEFLTFCENNNIKFREGIGINLKEKYDKIRDKNIRELLKL